MSSIVTLTMNPAIDVSTSADHVAPVHKLRCGAGRRDPGGGGINVARVASRLGAEVTAVYPVGGFMGQLLNRMIDAEGLKSIAIPVLGEARMDFTVLDKTTGEQYRFVMPGPELREAEWMACLKALAGLGARPDIICASGSLPPGVPDDVYARVAGIARDGGAKLVLDTSGAPLVAALEARVYLIKPSLRELRELMGEPLDGQASLIGACRSLIGRGFTELVALTLGADGALLVTAGGAWRAPALPIQPVSTVGAGDSFLGAMVWALASKMSLEDCFRYGVAGGSAAVLAPGTGLGRPQDVRRLLEQVTVESVPD
ncbi:MAG: 1-phosphofructokinase family hexose kinase [Beijerinckiaceae bacterium]|nr:1-phosphofructokinase family hexose kinase [Beijerinckiaceae bacterium]